MGADGFYWGLSEDKRAEATLPLDLGESRLPALSLALRIEHKRHPERVTTLVEIQDDKLCIYPNDGVPMYLDLKQAWKVLPRLVEFLSLSK